MVSVEAGLDYVGMITQDGLLLSRYKHPYVRDLVTSEAVTRSITI